MQESWHCSPLALTKLQTLQYSCTHVLKWIFGHKCSQNYSSAIRKDVDFARYPVRVLFLQFPAQGTPLLLRIYGQGILLLRT